MFKKRIVFKLTLSFVVVVLISMLTIGLIFIQIFRQYAFDSHKKTMFERASNISIALSENMNNSGQMRGFGGLIRFINTMAEAKVWITDTNGNPITISGMGMGQGENHSFTSEPLPQEAKNVINDVLSGRNSVSESFSNVYKEATLTIGVPIFDSTNSVIGSVLLHSPITGITNALNNAMNILLISLLCSLGIAIGLGVFYSIIFTRPLKKMNITALEMARGNYNVRTGIKQHDEIGQLGSSLDMLASELSDATDEINKLEQVRRDFVANVSHEFRTPLTVIRGSLEAISDGTIENEEDIKRYHNRMLSETRSLERLVSDLLDLSRLQSGKISINREPVNITNLISDVVTSMQAIATKKNIKIEYLQNYNLPEIHGDYDRLRQIFVIFIDNAIKYSPEKTTISIDSIYRFQAGNSLRSTRRVFKVHSLKKFAKKTNFFRRMLYRSSLNISITDQGYGIPPKELPYIWDRFYKADKSGQSNGTGLGLAIAKHLIELHEGSVSIRSEFGKGTVVSIQFCEVQR
jgi:signal transduction histidine kinase